MNGRIDEILGDINAYKQLLTLTDYEAIKYSEGWISEDEYADTKAKRQYYRNMINELQEELELLSNE